jgi:integrase
MNVKKYPESDPNFLNKIRGACRNDYERGMVYILQHTGCHVANLVATDKNRRLIMNSRGDIRWRRVKNSKPLKAKVPTGDREIVEKWLSTYPGKRTTRAIRYKIETIGKRAGFPEISPMTFRSQRACDLLDEGMSPHQVKHLIGTSLATLEGHYAQLKADRRIDEEDLEDEHY